MTGINALQKAAKGILALEHHIETFHPAVGYPVLSVNMIEAGIAHNVVPGEAKISIDRRLVPGETKETAVAVLRNAVAWFSARNVTVQRLLSDNGGAYRSHLWRDTCAELGITPKRTRPYRPQTNGKIERFHRTLAEGWAFKKFYASESARLAALPAWLHEYNHHRPHSAIGKRSPITRLDNLAGHHN